MLNSEFKLKEARVALVGLGLMGGSLGLALKKYRVCRQVIGLVRRSEAIEQALALDVVDEATLDPATALNQADLVIFSTPIRTIIRQMSEFSSFYKTGAIITDMGSTKQAITQAMAGLPAGLQPVGSHPMCGKEVGGMVAAEADLYCNAPWIITPLERSGPAAAEVIQQLAQAIGAKPLSLAAARHDKLVATISHLPYTLAATLVLTAQHIAQSDPAVWQVVAGGFRDTSRVAATETTMMLDILLTNREAVGQLLEVAQQQLGRLAEAICKGDEESLRALMEEAARQRRSLYQ